jgi:hypothetical protein
MAPYYELNGMYSYRYIRLLKFSHQPDLMGRTCVDDGFSNGINRAKQIIYTGWKCMYVRALGWIDPPNARFGK